MKAGWKFCKQKISVSENLEKIEMKFGTSKSSPVTGQEGPRGFQEVKVPRFRDNGTGWW
jgi:hypothetical protein